LVSQIEWMRDFNDCLISFEIIDSGQSEIIFAYQKMIALTWSEIQIQVEQLELVRLDLNLWPLSWQANFQTNPGQTIFDGMKFCLA